MTSVDTDAFVVKDHSQHTIGVEFSSRTVKLGEKRIKLQVREYPLPCAARDLCSTSYGILQDKNVSGLLSSSYAFSAFNAFMTGP
jgi:hypothetical protein